MRACLIAVLLGAQCLALAAAALAQSTAACPAGSIDMLDWMTLDADLRATQHLAGTANPLYTVLQPDKFYWIKGPKGYPSDINLYDNNYIYLWVTEYDWNNPASYKKFTDNTNMPFAPRCAQPGFPGSTIDVSNTSYLLHTDCNHSSKHTLKNAVNQVWGPYTLSLGGDLPDSLQVYMVSYSYNCDANFANCRDQEQFYVARRFGLVQWVHYVLAGGAFQQRSRSVFNRLVPGTAQPVFPCF